MNNLILCTLLISHSVKRKANHKPLSLTIITVKMFTPGPGSSAQQPVKYMERNFTIGGRLYHMVQVHRIQFGAVI